MNSALYIILGFLILFLLYFLLAWGLSSLYYWISKEKISFVKNIKITTSLAIVGFFSNISLMILLATFHIYFFTAVTAIVSLGLYFAMMKYFWKYNNFDAAIIAITLAIILNPAWLRLLGII